MDSHLNIVLLPPTEITHTAIELSNLLQKNNGLFVLGEQKNIPHLSLYTTTFPKENLSKIQAELQAISKNIRPISLGESHYETNHDVWVSIAYGTTPELLELQKTIVEALDPLRTVTLDTTTPFGYYNVGYAVDAPHITLTKLPTKDLEAMNMLPTLPLDITATEIGIFETGEHGTCQHLITKFSLGK